MRDFDYHPGEPDVRVFGVPESGVLERSEDVLVAQTADRAAPEPVVLRHYAFANEWFKLNATYGLDGDLVETGPAGGCCAINCDVSTPLVWVGPDATAVDLFLDVLVRVDTSYRVVDRSEFEAACSRRLISASEARHAEQGLKRLLQWITSGRLHELLALIPPTVAARAPSPLPFSRSPLAEVPAVAPQLRASWRL